MKYIIYGSDNCIWCNRSVDLLKVLKINYKYYNISDINKETNKLYKSIPKNYITIPKIFIIKNKEKPKFIGGFDSLLKSIEKNKISKKKSSKKKSSKKKSSKKKSNKR